MPRKNIKEKKNLHKTTIQTKIKIRKDNYIFNFQNPWFSILGIL